jgi:hypothetical protein
VLCATASYSQHAKREASFSFAVGGQSPLVVSGDDRSGFWRDPVILNLRLQVATDYIMSASIFLEHMSEGRNRSGLWSDSPNTSDPPPYNAEITEHLQMTLFGVEAARTLIRTGDLRFAFTVGLGYGLGSARADVRRITTNERKPFESCDTWHGLYLNSSIRARYTIYQGENYDIGVTASLRGWGFPMIGSFGECRTSYNGPDFNAIYEIGYLAGVAVGFF